GGAKSAENAMDGEKNRRQVVEELTTKVMICSPPTNRIDHDEEEKAIKEEIEKLDLAKDSDMTATKQERMKNLLRRNTDVFNQGVKGLSKTWSTQHYIDTGNHPPIQVKPQSPAQK